MFHKREFGRVALSPTLFTKFIYSIDGIIPNFMNLVACEKATPHNMNYKSIIFFKLDCKIHWFLALPTSRTSM